MLVLDFKVTRNVRMALLQQSVIHLDKSFPELALTILKLCIIYSSTETHILDAYKTGTLLDSILSVHKYLILVDAIKINKRYEHLFDST